MAKLYFSQLVPTVITSSSAASGYPAANAALLSIDRQWRATSAGASNINFNLGSMKNIAAIYLHDINAAALTATLLDATPTLINTGAIAGVANRYGRTRALYKPTVTSAQNAKIDIAAGTPTDGLAFWRIGSMYVMQSVVDVVNLQYDAEIETVSPQLSTDLPNGQTAVAGAGTRFARLKGRFLVANAGGAMTIANLLSAMRDGVCIFDMELTDAPHRMWPMRMIKSSDRESLKYPSHSEIDFEAVEVV